MVMKKEMPRKSFFMNCVATPEGVMGCGGRGCGGEGVRGCGGEGVRGEL